MDKEESERALRPAAAAAAGEEWLLKADGEVDGIVIDDLEGGEIGAH